ncbi:MAG: hypothetical protein NTU99_17880 [Pseudanabaena sp. LacPavin_0818_WC45_MAG_42_6]|nr:hypothetical protein [Pseudanabaena sp. LacPavin_0818_WC45_MAG_42_6]
MIGSQKFGKSKYDLFGNKKRFSEQKSWTSTLYRGGDILFATWVGLICAVPPCYMQTDFQRPAEAAELPQYLRVQLILSPLISPMIY